MGRSIYQTIEDWAEGVNTTVEADELPINASPRGRNSFLESASGGKAIVAKRRGCSTMNRTVITGSPAVHGQYAYNRLSGGAFTQYHLLVSNTGRLDTIDTSGVLTSISATAFTSGDYIPAFSTANNLVFMVNGQDKKKFNGTAVQTFGIAAPAGAPTLVDSAVAGLHDGTYEGRYTFYNSATGHESSAGPTSTPVTLTTNQIDWSVIAASADTQVTDRRLYIRNTATQAEFFLVATLSGNVATTKTTNVADTTLITLGPDTDENDEPPAGIKYLAWHGSRMFAATDTTLYYSQVGMPEAFDPDFFEQINPDDGQKITAIHAAQEVLIIFKSNATYVLDGTNPQTWTIRNVDPNVGCTSHRSILTVEGFTYWWSEQGPMIWDGANPPRPIGSVLIADTIAATAINYTYLHKIAAVADMTRELIVWSVPEVAQTRNTALLPYSYRLQRWVSDLWDPMDVASMAIVDDSAGQPWIYVGGYSGQIFKWWSADNDGVFTGTMRGSFTASSTSISTFTDSGAAFDTTGGGLIERKVTIFNTEGRQVGTGRHRITANTGTALTFGAANITGLTALAIYTYVIGGPAFEWDTTWNDNELPYHKKRFEYLFVQCKSTSTAITISIDLAFNFDTSTGQTRALSFSSTALSATWDASLWDSTSFGTEASVNKRLRVGRTGRIWKARIRNMNNDEPVTLQKIGIQAETLTTAIG